MRRFFHVIFFIGMVVTLFSFLLGVTEIYVPIAMAWAMLITTPEPSVMISKKHKNTSQDRAVGSSQDS